MATNRVTVPDFAARVGAGKSTIYNLRNQGTIPDLLLAERIQAETKGEVPLDSWLKAV